MKMRYSILLVMLPGFFGTHVACSQHESVYQRSIQIDTTSENLHFAAWQFSFIGEYYKALSSFDKAVGELTKRKSRKVPADLKPVPAAEYIIKSSRSSQVVIINEAHHQPLHRVFTESLLEGLYQNGFRYLGLEALAEDSLINTRKYPLQSDGYYTNEAQFGNMLRKALEIGFTVFGYEADSSGNVREKGQAANISKIFKRDPGAKMLIHCGFSHVLEGAVPVWGKAMAGEIKALTGIDPLTIDQVDLTEHSTAQHESEYYKPDHIGEAAIFTDRKGKPVKLASSGQKTDLQVMHPRSKFIQGRPAWLLRNSLVPYSLKQLNLDLKYPALVAAYREDEEKYSVPVDQIEIINTVDKVLILKGGKYRLKITDVEGNVQEIKVTIE